MITVTGGSKRPGTIGQLSREVALGIGQTPRKTIATWIIYLWSALTKAVEDFWNWYLGPQVWHKKLSFSFSLLAKAFSLLILFLSPYLKKLSFSFSLLAKAFSLSFLFFSPYFKKLSFSFSLWAKAFSLSFLFLSPYLKKISFSFSLWVKAFSLSCLFLSPYLKKLSFSYPYWEKHSLYYSYLSLPTLRNYPSHSLCYSYFSFPTSKQFSVAIDIISSLITLPLFDSFYHEEIIILIFLTGEADLSVMTHFYLLFYLTVSPVSPSLFRTPMFLYIYLFLCILTNLSMLLKFLFLPNISQYWCFIHCIYTLYLLLIFFASEKNFFCTFLFSSSSTRYEIKYVLGTVLVK